MQNLDCRRSAPGATSRRQRAGSGQPATFDQVSRACPGHAPPGAPPRPGRPRRDGPRCSLENSPKTADPLPDIRASSAPALVKCPRMAPMAGCRRSTGASRSFVPSGGSGSERCPGPGPAGARCRRPVLGQPAVGVGGRDAEVGQDQHDMPARPVHQRVELLAAAQAKRRAADEKERHIGPQRRGHGHQVGEREPEAPRLGSSPTSAAAASLLPPPRPACAGMRLTTRTRAPRGIARLAGRPPQRRGGAPHQVALVERHQRRVAVERERAAPRLDVTVSCRSSV